MQKDTLSKRLLIGLSLTIAIFAASILLSQALKFETDIIPTSFVTHALMLVLSVALIIALRKQVNYRIAMPKFKQVLKPIIIGFLTSLVINLAIGILTIVLTGKANAHPAVAKESVLQFFLFTFILASVAEEFLFRGFLQNYLKPFSDKGFKLFRRWISLPVLVSAITFSLAHLILLVSGVEALFMIRMLVFTFALGLIAGYYQEKYDNHAFAIIVHMAGNLMGLVSILMM